MIYIEFLTYVQEMRMQVIMFKYVYVCIVKQRWRNDVGGKRKNAGEGRRRKN